MGVVGAVLLLVFGMPGWADAQSALPGVAAVATAPSAMAVAPTYNDIKVEWEMPASYAADCLPEGVTSTRGNTANCTEDETPLTHFRVYYSTVIGFLPVNAEGYHDQPLPAGQDDALAVELAATVKGLKPDTRYYFQVAAANRLGAGPPHTTAPTEATTKAPVPAQVTGVAVMPGDMKLTVSWEAPNPDVGANRTNHVITMYRLQYRESQTVTNSPGAWMPTKPTEVMGTMTTYEITGLTNGTPYDVQVRAVNDATGVGDWSAQSPRSTGTPMAGTTTTPPPTTPPPTTPPPTTPPTTPPPDDGTVVAGAPEKVVIRTGTTSTTNSITFSWTTPGSGMSALVDYQLEYMVTGQSTAFTNNIGVGTGTVQAQIVPPAGNPPLKAGTTYMIRLRAQNKDQGYGPWSEYLTASTKAVPGPEPSPTVSKMAPPMVEAGDKMLKVSWTEPASEKSITHYQVDYKTASAKKWMEKPINVTELNYTISGLINDTAYVVRVRAVDGADNIGAWSDNGSGTPTGMPMPTPALPLFGAFGLGAGLLAVGRARMRRQAQLRGRREQRQMTR